MIKEEYKPIHIERHNLLHKHLDDGQLNSVQTQQKEV